MLSDPDTRARYDRFGHAGVSPEPAPHRAVHGLLVAVSDLLGAFFGDDMFGGGGRPGRRRGSDAAGRRRPDAGRGRVRSHPHGRGRPGRPPATCARAAAPSRARRVETCPTCGGAGPGPARRPDRLRPVRPDRRRAQPAAVAARRSPTRARPAAGGACGRVRTPIEVQIPAGIADGQRLRLSDRGHVGRAWGAAGRPVRGRLGGPDPRFERDGNDLVSVLELPFSQAALGATVSVETIDGPEPLEVRAGRPGKRDAGAARQGHPGAGRPRPRRPSGGRERARAAAADRRAARPADSSSRPPSTTTTYASDNGFFGRLRAAFR